MVCCWAYYKLTEVAKYGPSISDEQLAAMMQQQAPPQVQAAENEQAAPGEHNGGN